MRLKSTVLCILFTAVDCVDSCCVTDLYNQDQTRLVGTPEERKAAGMATRHNTKKKKETVEKKERAVIKREVEEAMMVMVRRRRRERRPRKGMGEVWL